MTEEYLVNKTFDEIKNSSNNIILFGSVGNGKTTLINKLSKSDGFSCTRDANIVQHLMEVLSLIFLD